MSKFTQKVKEYAQWCGADLVGIAPIERFKGAPVRMSPQGLLPAAKSVIVIAVHHPDAAVELSGEPTPHDIGPYKIQGAAMNPLLNSIAFRLAKFVEKEEYAALPMPVTNIWRYRPYKELDTAFAPSLAHRYAAVAAGLGEIGWSGLFLSPEYGPRQRLSSVITDAPLQADPMYAGPSLCDKCMECVKNCPTDAFRKEVRKMNRIEIGGKIFEFPDTNKWRCGWAETFALSLNLPIPERVDEKAILDTMAKYGYHAGEIGSCLRYCMPPHLRHKDPAYTRVYRRKRKAIKINSTKMSERIKEIAQQGGMDWILSGSLEEFREKKIEVRKHLPDAETALIIGTHFTDDCTKGFAQRRLDFISYDICRYLEKLGFSVISYTSLPDNLVASTLNIGRVDKSQNSFFTKEYGCNQIFMTILTGATLSPVRVFPCNRMKKLDKKSNQRLTEDCEFLALSKGADLFGVTPIRRLEEIHGSLQPKLKDEEMFEIKNKKRGAGPYVPQLEKIKQETKTPKDYISTATSVIVIGIHYSDTCIDRAGKPPAEVVDSYAGHAQIETVRQLGDVAFDLCRFLESMSYQAIATLDLFNHASKVITPWGLLADATANRYATIAAGLGEIGWNGVVLTPEHGPRQRFIAIVTDASLEYNSLYKGPSLCKRCFKCVDTCPVGALSEEKEVSFRVEERTFEFGKVDRLRCDWSKKYGLVGKAGPKYMGSKTNILPPENIRPKDFCEALKKMDPVQKLLLCILERCIAACPAGKEG